LVLSLDHLVIKIKRLSTNSTDFALENIHVIMENIINNKPFLMAIKRVKIIK